MTAATSPGKQQSRDAVFALVLFVIALTPRLFVALAWSGEPVWDA